MNGHRLSSDRLDIRATAIHWHELACNFELLVFSNNDLDYIPEVTIIYWSIRAICRKHIDGDLCQSPQNFRTISRSIGVTAS